MLSKHRVFGKKNCCCHYIWLRALVIIFLFTVPMCLTAALAAEAAAEFSVAELFDLMEQRSEKINALMARITMQNSGHDREVTLSIMNPDKFAVVFADGSSQVFFNGQKLWIHIAAVNEVFYHFSDSRSSLMSYFSWFNPKKIFTSLTRKTLFSLFHITPLKREKISETEELFFLRFSPKMESVFRDVFDVGFYEMAFSGKSYLPVEVVEYDRHGAERGRLKVISYSLNEDIAEAYFDYAVPEGAIMVPITVVLAQKLEECAEAVLSRVGKAAEDLKKRIMNWSF